MMYQFLEDHKPQVNYLETRDELVIIEIIMHPTKGRVYLTIAEQMAPDLRSLFIDLVEVLDRKVQRRGHWLTSPDVLNVREYWKQKRRRMVEAWGADVVRDMIKAGRYDRAVAAIDRREVEDATEN